MNDFILLLLSKWTMELKQSVWSTDMTHFNSIFYYSKKSESPIIFNESTKK